MFLEAFRGLLKFLNMLSRRLLRIKVIKALYAHFKSESDSLATSEKNLTSSIHKTYELYHQLLWLIVEVADVAQNRIELGLRKHLPTPEELHPNTRFVDNRVVAAIRNSKTLTDYLDRYKLGWVQYPELVKKLYAEMVASDYYKTYMADEKTSFKKDLRLVRDFYLHTVDASEELEEVVEEQSILWADDTDFANILVLRTLDDMKATQDDLPLLPQFKNEDDAQFAQTLFRETVLHQASYFEYIDKYTSNWDVERIAFMDTLIMATAMAELVSCPSIPVKVTLDEYIEIAKYYSTPGSSTFINGVLDKIVEEFRQEGRIEKAGRGLLDA